MHIWYRSKDRLADLLRDFKDGQIQIITRYGCVIVGGITSISIDPKTSKKREFTVELLWYAEFRYGTWNMTSVVTYNDVRLGNIKVAKVKKLVTIGYLRYYPQKNKKRVKLITNFEETIRFFHSDDSQALTVDSEGVISGPENPLFQD